MLATSNMGPALGFSLHGNIAMLIVLAVCLILILAIVGVMLKD